MNIKKYTKPAVALLIVICVMALTMGCVRISVMGGESIIGSAEKETRDYDFTDFTNIEVGNAFKVDITRSYSTHQVSITLSENLFDYLSITQNGSTLTIRLDPYYNYRNTTQETKISLPVLKNLELSGATRGTLTGFTTSDYMRFDISGASSLDLNNIKADDVRFDISGASRLTGELEAEELDLEISGASTVDISGSTDFLDVGVSGASSARLRNFPAVDASVNASGASSADVNVSSRLDITASGASRVTYAGNPSLDNINVSGGSTVSGK